MSINTLGLASGLSDHDLLARIGVLASREREATAELVAHLAELDVRPALYAAQSYGSLFRYCTKVLRLSEDAACNRIEAARACRSFPLIVDLLTSGAISLTSVRLLRKHLTTENHQAVLAKACGRSRREIEALVAELAPRPDVPSSVRKLPTVAPNPPLMSTLAASPPATHSHPPISCASEPPPPITAPPPTLPAPRPVVETTSPDRYRVQFTIGKESHDKLRRVQALLRREMPDGDPGAIFDRALTLLLEKVEKAKLGAATKPRAPRPIRLGTDRQGGKACGLAAGRWPVRLRLPRRSEMHGAHVPGVPPHAAVCARGTGHRREHLAALPAPQPIRGRAGFRPGRHSPRPT